MFRQMIKWLWVFMWVLAAPYAAAELKRVGPVDPAHGYPAWYQDATGLALSLCVPNAAELATGSCLIFASDLPNPSRPDHFPDNFLDEHFWYNLNTSLATASGNAKLVIALEAAFPGEVLAGTQIAFGRVRVVIDVPPPGGTYTITHPYGVETFPDVAPGSRAIAFTEDIGINCAIGDFTCALNSRVGPFLRAAATPGGPALPPVVLPGGNTYLADPAIPTAITGSPFPGNNIFRVDGPNIGGPGVNTIQTTLFNLMGRVHTAPIPSVTLVERATYTRDSSSAKIDLFASTVPSLGSATPRLSFAGANVPPTLMSQSANGRNFYGQAALSSPQQLPASIVVTNNGDVPPSKFEANLVDEVRVTQADYDVEKQVLVVSATSSDALLRPTLEVEGFGPLVGGTRAFQGVRVPPAFVNVASAAGGRARTFVVTTAVEAGPLPTAQDDSASVAENQSVTIDVLQNDTNIAGMTVKLLGAPAHGTATIDPTGITYRPALNFFGTDTFTYVLVGAPGTADSNIATVTVDVAMVPIKPATAADTAAVTLTSPATAVSIDVLANDSAPNGTLDPASLRITQLPASGTATVNAATGRIQFTPQAVGTVSFAYTVRDNWAVESDPTAVTVTVSAAASPTITINKATAQTSTSKGVTSTKWVVDGTTTRSTSAQTNSVTVYIGNRATGTPLGTAAVDAVGDWRLTLTSSRAPDATRTVSVRSSTGAVQQAFPIK